MQCIPGAPLVVSREPLDGGIELSCSGVAVWADPGDCRGVGRAAAALADDMGRVLGRKVPQVDHPAGKCLVVVGTRKNALVCSLEKAGRIDGSCLEGRGEATLAVVVENPCAGVEKALILVGSDRRGAIYGAYGLCEHLGVSPWHWWNRTPVERRDRVWVAPGKGFQSGPAVRFRGIFLNDEYPALTRWVAERWGHVPEAQDPPMPGGIANYGREFHGHLFDLILRLGGNYLWPAMWNNAFNEDDPVNPVLADEVGVVMGTSHQEPMIRAQKEWDRRFQSTLGHWDWTKHRDTITEFWREGVRRNKGLESVVTIGLRGADDTEMAGVEPAEAMAMLEGIVAEQKRILSEEGYGADQPLMWCLYKEILDYYEAGMKVPDDVILLWGEDNWGNLRRVPSAVERKRSGGAGIYYHFDYHGGPRSYQWTNTTMNAKIADQMGLAWQYGADQVWIVNVGHLKGYELPTEFFIRMAWDPASWTGDRVPGFAVDWARREFGGPHAVRAARVVEECARLNALRKPELLAPETFSVVHAHEAEEHLARWDALEREAREIGASLPADRRAAWMQTAEFPVRAGALVNRLYVAAARNRLYATQGRASADWWEKETRKIFADDLALMDWYNREFAGGFWNHFMDQTHLGYVAWNDPEVNSLRAVEFRSSTVQKGVFPGMAVEGIAEAWPGRKPSDLELVLAPGGHSWVDVFRRGSEGFDAVVKPSAPWLHAEPASFRVDGDCRVKVWADSRGIPSGILRESLRVELAGSVVTLPVTVENPDRRLPEGWAGFLEGGLHVAMDATAWSRRTSAGGRYWEVLEGYGITGSAMASRGSVDDRAEPGDATAVLEWDFHLHSREAGTLVLYVAPTLNYRDGQGLELGWSVDGSPVGAAVLVPKDYSAQNGNRDWEDSVWENLRRVRLPLGTLEPGCHVVRVHQTDPGVVLQKVVVDLGGAWHGPAGPRESRFFH